MARCTGAGHPGPAQRSQSYNEKVRLARPTLDGCRGRVPAEDLKGHPQKRGPIVTFASWGTRRVPRSATTGYSPAARQRLATRTAARPTVAWPGGAWRPHRDPLRKSGQSSQPLPRHATPSASRAPIRFGIVCSKPQKKEKKRNISPAFLANLSQICVWERKIKYYDRKSLKNDEPHDKIETTKRGKLLRNAWGPMAKPPARPNTFFHLENCRKRVQRRLEKLQWSAFPYTRSDWTVRKRDIWTHFR